MEIVFLGTASMVPTKERNPSSIFISYDTEGILVDCGEGTQRQMKNANIKLTKITKILITHWHGDHVLGLSGLIMSLGASDYDKTLQIFGPEGTKKFFTSMIESCVFDRRIDIKITEIKKGAFFENKDLLLECLSLEHGVKTLGFNIIEKDKRNIRLEKIKKLGMPEGPLLGKLQEGKTVIFNKKKITPEEVTTIKKGKKVTIISDTRPCNNCYKLAINADILIAESTYTSKYKEKSEKYFHMTASQAAEIANGSGAKKLILTHFSARYKDMIEILEEAKTYFNNVVCAYDLMKIKI